MIENLAIYNMTKVAEGYVTNAELAAMLEADKIEQQNNNSLLDAIGTYGGATLGGEVGKALVNARNLKGWQNVLGRGLGTGLGAGAGLLAIRGLNKLFGSF